MSFFNFNGKVFSDEEKIIGPTNRGLRYGDGVFETLKFKNGNIILADNILKDFGAEWKRLSLPFLFILMLKNLQRKCWYWLKKTN